MKTINYLRFAVCVMLVVISTSFATTDKPYPPIIEKSQSYTSPTEEQKRWALATCAVLTESNRRRHDLLGGSERTPEETQSNQRSLAKWWGVENRKDFLEKLLWIENGGHRRGFDMMARSLSAATPDQLAEARQRLAADVSKSSTVEIIMKYKDEFGEKSITAWDYDRYVALCGWGYIAGYLSEEEAWQRIMPVARALQKTFDSWKDLGKNHVVGREFWSWEQTQERGALTRQCYESLLTNPSSPWVQLKWETDLTP